MRFSIKSVIAFLAVATPSALAYVNGPCNGMRGACIDYNECYNYGGNSYVGYCPGTGNNIRCCQVYRTSRDGRSGPCLPTELCSEESLPGYCPGGSNVQLCV
ncbi:hypothetical protein BCR32DRAFT_191335, partial [Anaeromyces robustus]